MENGEKVLVAYCSKNDDDHLKKALKYAEPQIKSLLARVAKRGQYTVMGT